MINFLTVAKIATIHTHTKNEEILRNYRAKSLWSYRNDIYNRLRVVKSCKCTVWKFAVIRVFFFLAWYKQRVVLIRQQGEFVSD